MSLRKPSPLNFTRPAGVEFDCPKPAMKAWRPGVQAKAGDEAVIQILDVIGFDFWTGEGITTQSIGDQLAAIGDAPVTVQINSPGGDFFEGLGIYNLLAQHPAHVTVQVLALAASAASVIAMAGDQIEMAKAAMLMIHNTQWVAIGDRNLMRETADTMEKFDQLAAQLYADRTGRKPATMAKLMDDETWLTGPEAVKEGFADGLMAAEPKDGGAKQSLLYRVEAALTPHLPRSQVRALLRDLKSEIQGTPRAALDDPKPGAGDTDFTGLLADLKSFRV